MLHAESAIPSPSYDNGFSVLRADETLNSIYSQNFTVCPDAIDQLEHSYENQPATSPPVKDQDNCKIETPSIHREEMMASSWEVAPSEVFLNRKSNDFKSQVDLVNSCEEYLK